ncbi:hypothetical protein VTI74DRAFT_4317 [Chaetomium olivicolor]
MDFGHQTTASHFVDDPPPQNHPVITRPFRNPDGTLSAQRSTFNVSSGVLLWGYILPIYYGSTQKHFTNNAASASFPLPGGTIIQRVHTYRSAARLGTWKVRRYFSNWQAAHSGGGIDRLPSTTSDADHAGWVLCHADVDPLAVISRVKSINAGRGAASHGNAHVDQDVLYIGRYDWSSAWHHPTDSEFPEKFQAWAEEVVGPVVPTEWYTPKMAVREGAYFVAVDVEDWGLDFIRAFKWECEEDGNLLVERVFERREGGYRFGAYVRHPYTEYEFGEFIRMLVPVLLALELLLTIFSLPYVGWLVFSGEKHAQHDADELIAIVYDDGQDETTRKIEPLFELAAHMLLVVPT